jgi:hypothetical protein
MRKSEFFSAIPAVMCLLAIGWIACGTDILQPPKRVDLQLKAWAEANGYAEYRLNKSTGKIEYFVDVDRLPRGDTPKVSITSRDVRVGMTLFGSVVFRADENSFTTIRQDMRTNSWVWRDGRWCHMITTGGGNERPSDGSEK